MHLEVSLTWEFVPFKDRKAEEMREQLSDSQRQYRLQRQPDWNPQGQAWGCQ